jgi:cytochrome c oxidase assembly factor 4
MSKEESGTKDVAEEEELDEWYIMRCLRFSSYTDSFLYRDQRIFSTGCAGRTRRWTAAGELQVITSLVEEQLRMNDCYYDKKDWRICRKEVCLKVVELQCIFHSELENITPRQRIEKANLSSFDQMEAFRECWKRQGNEVRTQSKDAS